MNSIHIPPMVSPLNNQEAPFQSGQREPFRRLGPDLIRKVEEAIQNAGQAKDRDVIALIGTTGAGKSTTINQLLGKRMVFRKINEIMVVRVADGEQEEAEIGRKVANSTTLFTKIYPRPGRTDAFADCGGFLDTRGISTDIAAVTSLKLTLQNARSIGLVLCVTCNDITSNNSVHFFATLERVLGTLLVDYRAHQSSILLMITQPKIKENEDGTFSRWDKNDVIHYLREIVSALTPDSSLHRPWVEFLLRENGRFISVSNPISNDSKDEILRTLDGMPLIRNTNEAFQTAYSESSRLALFDEMTAISSIGIGLYQQKIYLEQELRGYREESARLEEHRVNTDRLIEQVRPECGMNLEQIRAAEEGAMRERTGFIQQEQARLDALTREIAELEANLTALRERLEERNRLGEAEHPEPYWTDSIEKEGIVIPTRQLSDVFWMRLKMVPGPNKYEPIEKHFSYEGPEVLRVVKDPVEHKYWSKEVYGPGVYSVLYTTAPGERALATVKVFIKRRHLGEEVALRETLIQDQQNQERERETKTREIARIQGVINQLTQASDLSTRALERLEGYQNSLTIVEQAITVINRQVNQAEESRRELQSTLDQHQNEFNLVKDYLALSGDVRLANNPIVKKFLILETAIQNG